MLLFTAGGSKRRNAGSRSTPQWRNFRGRVFDTLLGGIFGGAMLLAAESVDAQVVLQGDYIQSVVNSSGNLTGFGPDTLRFDSSGTGNFTTGHSEWTMVYEGFSVKYGSGGSTALIVETFNNGFSNLSGPVSLSSGATGFDHAASWSASVSGVLDMNHVYAFNEDSKHIHVTTTITALFNVDDVRFLRHSLPFVGTQNHNRRGNVNLGLSTSDWVSAENPGTGATLGYYTDSLVAHNAGIVPYPETDPDVYLAATLDDQISYSGLGLGFDLGDLVNGQSVVLVYWIAMGANIDDFTFTIASNLATRAQTVNQIAIATYLDAQNGGSTPGLQDVIDELNALDDPQLLAALDSMSGAIYGSLPNANFQHTSYYLSQIASRLRNKMVPYGSASYGSAYGDVASADPTSASRAAEMKQREVALVSFAAGEQASNDASGGDSAAGCGSCDCLPCCGCSMWTGWITGYGLGGDAQSDGNADGFRYGLGGTQFGLEKQVSDCTTFGLWGNMAWSNVRGEVLDENADIENYHFGAHFTSLDDEAYWIGIAGAGYDHYDVRRQMNILAPVTAAGDMNGWQANAYLERGLTFCHNGWNVQPYVALQYIHLSQDELVETGAGALNLDIADLDANSLRGILGGRFSKAICTANGRLVTPEIRAAWMHEFLDTNQVINAGLGGIGGAGFAVRGVDLGRDWATLGTGFNVQMNDAVRLFAGYDVQFNSNQTFHVGSGGVEFVW